MGDVSSTHIENLNTEDLPVLAELDSRGWLVTPFDHLTSYRDRIKGLRDFAAEVERELAEKGSFELDADFILPAANRIDESIIDETARITEDLYAFSVRWVPGFFLSKSLGVLWGGCSITEPESFMNLFLVRKEFTQRPRWFIYRRDELIAHELCHAARNVLDDHTYEEYFAYQTSPFRGRRYLGGCFRTRADALLFLGPVLLLLAVQTFQTISEKFFAIWPFWIFALAYPAFLLVRNQWEHVRIRRAQKNLQAAGIAFPQAVLFRSILKEIKQFAQLRSPEQILTYIDQLAASELRWRVIRYRFISKEPVHDQNS